MRWMAMIRSVTGGLALAGLASAAAAAPADGPWLTYANDRFGTTVDYPAMFSVRRAPPANGDGQTFQTADGRARLTVYGHFNVENETTRQLMDARRVAGTTYGYAAAAKNSFVLSGARSGRISYIRCRLQAPSRDVVGCFELEYAAEEARAWDGAVARIGRSLRFGASWYDR